MTLAWGLVGSKGNTIGRDSSPLPGVELRIDGRSFRPNRNWQEVTGLRGDGSYHYEIFKDSRKADAGDVRTLPEKTDRLAFLVIGDYGNGEVEQYLLAATMENERQKREKSANPVRFVLTTGDNIYGDNILSTNSGSEDRHWDRKFFSPYKQILRHIPFYPTLGNHDGNESERSGDLAVYLDNFFFPGGRPARYYSFSVGGFADFFALDTTRSSLSGQKRSQIAPDGDQSKWLREVLSTSRAPWKIAYFHHPPFTAGPLHSDSLDELQHWVDSFGQHGVQVVFNGHEHNLQISARNSTTRNVQYVVTGSGGSLRDGEIRDKMEKASIQGWAAVRQFLLVEIEGRSIRLTPICYKPFRAIRSDGSEFPLPLEWERK